MARRSSITRLLLKAALSAGGRERFEGAQSLVVAFCAGIVWVRVLSYSTLARFQYAGLDSSTFIAAGASVVASLWAILSVFALSRAATRGRPKLMFRSTGRERRIRRVWPLLVVAVRPTTVAAVLFLGYAGVSIATEESGGGLTAVVSSLAIALGAVVAAGSAGRSHPARSGLTVAATATLVFAGPDFVVSDGHLVPVVFGLEARAWEGLALVLSPLAAPLIVHLGSRVGDLTRLGRGHPIRRLVGRRMPPAYWLLFGAAAVVLASVVRRPIAVLLIATAFGASYVGPAAAVAAEELRRTWRLPRLSRTLIRRMTADAAVRIAAHLAVAAAATLVVQ